MHVERLKLPHFNRDPTSIFYRRQRLRNAGVIDGSLSNRGQERFAGVEVGQNVADVRQHLAGIVVGDIIRSNFAVARIILYNKKRVAGFVKVPLDLRNINGLAILACIITATPGTIWVQFNRVDGVLLVHVLDLVDEDEWVRLIKNRYESLLMEIFGA